MLFHHFSAFLCLLSFHLGRDDLWRLEWRWRVERTGKLEHWFDTLDLSFHINQSHNSSCLEFTLHTYEFRIRLHQSIQQTPLARQENFSSLVVCGGYRTNRIFSAQALLLRSYKTFSLSNGNKAHFLSHLLNTKSSFPSIISRCIKSFLKSGK